MMDDIRMPVGWKAFKINDKMFYLHLKTKVFTLTFPLTAEHIPHLIKDKSYLEIFTEVEKTLKRERIEADILGRSFENSSEEYAEENDFSNKEYVDELSVQSTMIVSKLEQVLISKIDKEKESSLCNIRPNLNLILENTLKMTDDDEIIDNLTSLSFTPITLVTVMKEKEKVFLEERFEIDEQELCKKKEEQLKTYIVFDKKRQLTFKGTHRNKTKSKHIACLSFLRGLYPEFETYGELVDQFLKIRLIKLK